jgi:hypothetical protein
MLAEEEMRERAKYCYCVLVQLGGLLENDRIAPSRYLECLEHSSLDLAGDEFISMSIREGAMSGEPDGGLGTLVAFYEGLIHALCAVLETDLDGIREEIPLDFLETLVTEIADAAG